MGSPIQGNSHATDAKADVRSTDADADAQCGAKSTERKRCSIMITNVRMLFMFDLLFLMMKLLSDYQLTD